MVSFFIVDNCFKGVDDSMKNNIKTAREKRNLTQQDCADLFRVKIRSWQTYEQGVSEPKYELLCRIADEFEVTTDYLLGREQKSGVLVPLAAPVDDDKFIEIYSQLPEYAKQIFIDTMIKLSEARCKPTQECMELPMSELPVSAGTGTWLEDGYNTPVTVRRTKEAERANVVIRVSGDSMEPLYSDGDKVLVKIQPDVEPGEIGIFIVDSQGYIKKKGSHELISVNPEYDNIRIDEYTDCRCFGKVLGKAEIIE